MTSANQQTAPLRPDDLHKITLEAENARVMKHLEEDRKAEAAKKEIEEAFKAREVRPDAMERVNAAVRRAAEAGKHEVEIVRFSAKFCNDGGRRINNNEADWPDSLEGFAKRAYETYVQNLKPHGYRIKAQVMDYPGGMMGDIALFLVW